MTVPKVTSLLTKHCDSSFKSFSISYGFSISQVSQVWLNLAFRLPMAQWLGLTQGVVKRSCLTLGATGRPNYYIYQEQEFETQSHQ